MVVDLLFVQFQKQPTIFGQCLSDFAYLLVKSQKKQPTVLRDFSCNLNKFAESKTINH